MFYYRIKQCTVVSTEQFVVVHVMLDDYPIYYSITKYSHVYSTKWDTLSIRFSTSIYR